MGDFSSTGFLQRPKSSGLDSMEFQFMPGPSPRGKPPQGKGPTAAVSPNAVPFQSGVQVAPRSEDSTLMPPPPPLSAEIVREFAQGPDRPWEGQGSNLRLSASKSQRHSLPRPEQSLDWTGAEGTKPPSRKRSATMDNTRQLSGSNNSSCTTDFSSLAVFSDREMIQSKGEKVQTSRSEHSVKSKTASGTTSLAADSNQWGLDLLDMGFDVPKDIPSVSQKRDSSAISTGAETNGSKRKQARPLEFYETPQAKELEARLNEMSSERLGVKQTDNKVPEVIDLSDDDGPTSSSIPKSMNPPQTPVRQDPRGHLRTDFQRSLPVETLEPHINRSNMSQMVGFQSDYMKSIPKQDAFEKPSSGRKVGNLIQQQQSKLREMQRRNEAPSRGQQERTLSLHSSQGAVTPQPFQQPNMELIQASRTLQTAMLAQSGEDNFGQKLGSDLGTMSGEQQLSIALTQLAVEKTALEKKLSRLNQDYRQQSIELLNLRQENAGLRSENQRFKSVVSSLKAQVSSITENVRICTNDLTQLGEEAVSLRTRVKDCVVEGSTIKEEVKKASQHATSIGERIGTFEGRLYLVRDMELERDRALGTVDILRQQLSDNVGELSLARDRVSTLEVLLDKASRRVASETEQAVDVAGALAEIKDSCTSGFGDLQTLLKSILNVNAGAAAQTSDMEKLLTCLFKSETKEVAKKVNGVEKVLKEIKQDMRQAEKRIRRVALGGGVKVMDKLVTATEALEKLFRLECEGIMKTVEDCLKLSREIQEDATKQPEYIKVLRNNLESVGERVKSIFTETKDIHEIAINDRQYIAHLVGQNESLLEKIKLLEGKSEELAVLKINKIQVDMDLRDSRELCNHMGGELEGLKELGKENLKSIAHLEKQLETALAVPKEDPSLVATLRSRIDKLEKNVESLRTIIAEKEQQSITKDRQIEDLTAKFLALKKVNEDLKEQTATFEEEKKKYESILRNQYEEEKAKYIKIALDERNTERIALEKNAQRLCERIKVEAQNSVKMLGTNNTKLQTELIELRGELTECQKSIDGYTQEICRLDSMHKASAEKEKEYQFELSTQLAEKAVLGSNLEAARDLVRNLETALESLRTSNLEEKLNQADLEVLSLKKDIDRMQRRVEIGSGSLNTALNTIYTRDERREINRSLEDAIAEVQSLCEEICTRSHRKFVESGTCMGGLKFEAPLGNSSMESGEKYKLKAEAEATNKEEHHTPKNTDEKSGLNETLGSLQDMKHKTLVESTPPPALHPPSEALATEPQIPVSTKEITSLGRDELEDCIPATQTQAARAQGKKRPTKATAPSDTPSKTLQMLLGQSLPIVKNLEESFPTEKSSSTFIGSETLTTSEISPTIGKKRVRIEIHKTPSKGPEPVVSTPTPSKSMVPPTQPRAKRPRYERPATTKQETTNQNSGSVSRTATERSGPKDIKPSPTIPEPQLQAPSPVTAGPKRKRAPTKRG